MVVYALYFFLFFLNKIVNKWHDFCSIYSEHINHTIMKMKVEDLRVGDWVTNKLTACKGQVEEIYSDSVKLKDDSVYDISFIQPLYLTEEILQDSCLVKVFNRMESTSQYECMYFMKDDSFLCKCNRGFDLCAVYLNDDQRWESIAIAKIIFVHELQHIFQVLGLDLELNLDSLA